MKFNLNLFYSEKYWKGLDSRTSIYISFPHTEATATTESIIIIQSKRGNSNIIYSVSTLIKQFVQNVKFELTMTHFLSLSVLVSDTMSRFDSLLLNLVLMLYQCILEKSTAMKQRLTLHPQVILFNLNKKKEVSCYRNVMVYSVTCEKLRLKKNVFLFKIERKWEFHWHLNCSFNSYSIDFILMLCFVVILSKL